MSPTPGTGRGRLLEVLLVAACVISLEIVSFQALSFVGDYLMATRVLGIALMGIALGGVLSWFVPPARAERVEDAVLALLPVAVLATLPVVMWLSPRPALMMALMTAPYVLASVYISSSFNRLPPGRVYAWDLAGAGLGALLAVLIIPQWREEGSIFALAVLGAVPLLLRGLRSTGRARGVRVAVAAMAAVVGAGLLVAHVAQDPFNLLLHSVSDYEAFPRKISRTWTRSDGKPRYRLLYSRGSLIERIDIVQSRKRKNSWLSVYNGRVVDTITRQPAEVGDLDNRMPTLLKAGQDPATLLVGPSGQGLCKAVQALGEGHVDAVEINGAIAGLMSGPMYKRSGRAYEGFDLTVGDVRTFLATTQRKYDYITLLNTHRIWSMGHQGPPEYVHTLEAMRDYFGHLEDDGFVLFEERNINRQAELGIRRVLWTALDALAELPDVTDPSQHVAIWELYHGCKPEQWFATPQRCNRSKLFSFVMIKRTPITTAEQDHLLEWGEILGARKPGSSGDYRGILWRYLPEHPTEHAWTAVVGATDRYAVSAADPAEIDLSTITDDRPFPYDVFKDRTAITTVLKETAALAGGMVALPTLLSFLLRRRERDAAAVPGRLRTNAALLVGFSVLGLGYMLIEVVLIQKLGIFLSSPVISLAVVLATLLISSGLGGALSARLSKARAIGAVGVAVALGLLAVVSVDATVAAFMFLPLPLRALVAVAIVAPLGVAMGVPFPYGLRVAKQVLSDRHAGLFFGINGAVAAVATPLALWLGMLHGLNVALLAGVGAYALTALLLAVARGPEAEQADASAR